MGALTSALMPLLLLLAGPGEVVPDCSDVQRQDLCVAGDFAALRGLYGVPSAEEVTADGTQMVRAVFSSIGDRPIRLVTAIRRPGERPHLESVSLSIPLAGEASSTLIADLTDEEWQELVDESKLIGLNPLPEVDASGNIVPCFAGYKATVETMIDGTRHENTQDNCPGSKAANLAGRLLTMMLASDLSCSLLDTSSVSSALYLLDWCHSFQGNRNAAAQTFNRITEDAFTSPRWATTSELESLFHPEAELHWSPDKFDRGVAKAACSWQEHLGRGAFVPTSLTGETANRVRVEGYLEQADPNSGGERFIKIPVAMIWERDGGAEFKLRRLDLRPSN